MRRLDLVRSAIGLIFVASGLANIYTAATNPEEYRSFSETAYLQVYRDLISSVSVSTMPLLLGLVSVYEFTLGALILTKGMIVRVGLGMGILFAMALSLLGPDELPALVLVPVFGYLMTKEFDRTPMSSLLTRSRPAASA